MPNTLAPSQQALPVPLAAEIPDGPGAFLALAQRLLLATIANIFTLDDLATYPAADYEARILHVDEIGANVQAQDGVWVQISDAKFTNTTARDTAYARASAAYRIAGVIARTTADGITWRHNGTAWLAYDSPLIPLSLTPGWTTASATIQVRAGVGYLNGRLSATGAAGVTFTTLPAGFRPIAEMVQDAIASAPGAIPIFQSDGQLVFFGKGASVYGDTRLSSLTPFVIGG